MNAQPQAPPTGPEVTTEGFALPRTIPGSLATSTDHKAIGVLYLGASLGFLAVALTLQVLMRIQLLIPENTFLVPEIFDRLLSL